MSTDLIFGRDYYMRASWEARPETPEELAVRFLRHVDLLCSIDPFLALWLSGARRPKKLETIRDCYAEVIAAQISTDDWGEPVPIEGYWFGAITRGHPRFLSYAINIHAGAHMYTRKFQNNAYFATSSVVIPDPAAITYRIYKAALLAMVEAWDPADCLALPHELLDFIGEGRGHFHEVWMQYLSAPLARLIKLPKTAVIDHLPNGGLLMSATTETFRVDNPVHLAVARDIAAAIEPLNKLPCVHDPDLP